MKNSLLIFCLFTLFIETSKAQDFVRRQEFQLSMGIPQGIRALSVYYKLNFKNNQDKFWRARLGALSDDVYHSSTGLIHNNSKSFLAVGFEKRIPPTKNSQIFGGVEIYGLREIINGYSPDSLQFTNPQTEILEVGLGFPVGIIFNKTSKWFVGIEMVPSLRYQKTIKDEYKLSPNPGENWGYNIYSFAICFGYRIPTK